MIYNQDRIQAVQQLEDACKRLRVALQRASVAPEDLTFEVNTAFNTVRVTLFQLDRLFALPPAVNDMLYEGREP